MGCMPIQFKQLKKRMRKVKEFYDDVGKQFGRTQAEVRLSYKPLHFCQQTYSNCILDMVAQIMVISCHLHQCSI
jgi:hypothetical protein